MASDDDSLLSWAVDTDGDNKNEITLSTESKIIAVLSLVVLGFIVDAVFNGGQLSSQLLNSF